MTIENELVLYLHLIGKGYLGFSTHASKYHNHAVVGKFNRVEPNFNDCIEDEFHVYDTEFGEIWVAR